MMRRMPSSRRPAFLRAWITCVFVVIAVVLTPLAAQPWYMYDAPGTWKPWKMTLSSSARTAARATPAELKAFEAELIRFTEIWKRAPGVASPLGFSVETFGHLTGMAPGSARTAKGPIAGGVTFAAFPIFEYERNGTRVREDSGETELLGFMINDLSPHLIGRPGPEPWRAVDQEVIFPFVQKGERGGFPLLEEIVVMTKRTAPLYAPLSLQEAWQMQITASTHDVTEATEVVRRFQARLDTHLDPAERARRQARYDGNAKDNADPAGYLRQMAEVEAITEKSLRSELAATSSTMTRLRTAEKDLAAAQAGLAALTPEQRAAEACYVKDATRVEGRLRAGPANARCLALARVNATFFDTSLPRTAPQIAILWQARRCYEDKAEKDARARGPKSKWVAGCEANKALIESWDREAILTWLK